jgi:GAF domain-containing protein
MKAPELPHDEALRIATLRELTVLDTEPEERLELLTAYASSRFGVPIALVSLVDTDRQWFKARCGLDATQTSRDISFCGHAVLQDGIFEIRDARADLRFADNPLVTGEPHIRFYAGCPLTAANGQRVGTLCLIDRKPRVLDEADREHLRHLALVVMEELESRSGTRRESASASYTDSREVALG